MLAMVLSSLMRVAPGRRVAGELQPSRRGWLHRYSQPTRSVQSRWQRILRADATLLFPRPAPLHSPQQATAAAAASSSTSHPSSALGGHFRCTTHSHAAASSEQQQQKRREGKTSDPRS